LRSEFVTKDTHISHAIPLATQSQHETAKVSATLRESP